MAILNRPLERHELEVLLLKDLLRREFGSSHTVSFPELWAPLPLPSVPLPVVSFPWRARSQEAQQLSLAAAWPQSMPKKKPSTP